MTYVIASPCVDLLDKTCIDECPADCIHEGQRMLYIHQDECVDCGACEPVCPVDAISFEAEVPGQWKTGTVARERRRTPRAARSGRPRHGAGKRANSLVPAGKIADQFVTVLRMVGQGYLVLDSRLRSLIGGTRGGTGQRVTDGGELPELTAREGDILQSVARGCSIRQTARTLGISPTGFARATASA